MRGPFSPSLALLTAIALTVSCTPGGRRPSDREDGGGSNGPDTGATGGDGGYDGAATGGTGGTVGAVDGGGTGGNGGRGGAAGWSGTGGAGGTAGAEAPRDAGRPDNGCSENFDLQRGPPPNVVIVLDKSGSMNMVAPGGTGTLWVQTTAAIKNVVMSTEAEIKWGIGFFPNLQNGGDNCSVDPVEVPVAPNNSARVAAAIGTKMPTGGTPTRKAVELATTYLDTVADPSRKYLLLATDGDPNCGVPACTPPAVLQPNGSCCTTMGGSMSCTGAPGGGAPDAMAAEAAVAAAAAKGYNTFVVGLAINGTFSGTLDRLATAGKEPRMAAPEKYYKADDQAGLESAMRAIAAQIVTCEFPLSKVPAEPDRVRMFPDGNPVLRDPTRKQGWEYGPGMMSIIFYGASCDMIQSGTGKDVTAYFGCGTA